MSARHPLASLPRMRRGGLLADRRGVAAVEFALIAPVLFLLYLGGTEVTRFISADRKVSLAARVAADLVARETATAISEATLVTVCKGTLAMMAPFATNDITVTVTAIKTDSKGVSTVGWSRKFTGGNCAASVAGTAKGTAVTPPDGITTNSASLIWSKVEYTYSTMFEMVFNAASVPLEEEAYMRPRTMDNLCYSSCS